MHRALETPEIVLEIVSHLYLPEIHYPRHAIPKARRTLLALALSNKIFTVAALNALWYRMEDLIPLFLLLGNFFTPENSPSFVQGPISQEGLDCFNSYAPRIRVYNAKRSGSARVTSSACLRVIHALRRLFLLPRLQYLEVVLPTRWQETLFLLHAGLVKIDMREAWPGSYEPTVSDITNTDVLRSAVDVCSHLQHLRITAAQDISGADLKKICKIQHLKDLELSAHPSCEPFELQSDFFSTMASSSALSSVTVSNLRCIPSSVSSHPVSLPSLVNLHIAANVDSLKHMKTTIFGANAFPSLRKLALALYLFDAPATPGTSEWWYTFCNALSDSFPILTRFELKGSRDLGLAFSPLSKIFTKHLKKLILSPETLIPLTRADLTQLSLSAPALELFHFIGEDTYGLKPNPQILIDIASTLSNLTTLKVLVDTREFPAIKELPIPCNNLQNLRLVGPGGPPTSPISAARFFHRLFPYLIEFRYPPSDSEMGRSWLVLESVLQGLWAAREEERARAHAGSPIALRPEQRPSSKQIHLFDVGFETFKYSDLDPN